MKPKQKGVQLWCFWYRFKTVKTPRKWVYSVTNVPRRIAEKLRESTAGYADVGPLHELNIVAPYPPRLPRVSPEPVVVQSTVR